MTDFNERTKTHIEKESPFQFTEIKMNEVNGLTFYDFTFKNSNKEIILCTENEEYSVFFSTYHCHFTPDTESDELNTIKEAIEFISDIINENIIIVSYYKDEIMKWGTSIGSDETPEIEPGCRIELESWNDTYSRTISTQ